MKPSGEVLFQMKSDMAVWSRPLGLYNNKFEFLPGQDKLKTQISSVFTQTSQLL